MILDLILLLFLIAALGGFGWGWHGGTFEPASPLGVILMLVIVLLLISLIWPLLWPHYPPPPQ
jgi:hypothetical protein